TGSKPAVPPIDGLAGVRTWDNRTATSASAVPERLLVLGGGPVGAELAQAGERLGAREGTGVGAAAALAAQFEPFAGEQLRSAFAAEGIDVVLGASVERATREGDDGPVTLTLRDGRAFTGDELLVATGRSPRTGDVGLDAVGLTPGKAV